MERPRKNITATIQPRKATDKGGWLCMPLADNIPNGKKGGERSTARSAVICVGRDRKTKLLFSTTDWMELHAHGAL